MATPPPPITTVYTVGPAGGYIGSVSSPGTTLFGNAGGNYVLGPGGGGGGGGVFTINTAATGMYNSNQVTVRGSNPKIGLDNDRTIDLNELYELVNLMKAFRQAGVLLPIAPNADMLKEHPVLAQQWQDLLDLCKQYNITEALMTNPKDMK